MILNLFLKLNLKDAEVEKVTNFSFKNNNFSMISWFL